MALENEGNLYTPEQTSAPQRQYVADPAALGLPPQRQYVADPNALGLPATQSKREYVNPAQLGELGLPHQAEPESALATGLRHFVHALPATGVGLATGGLYGTAGGPGGIIGGAIVGGLAGFGTSYAQSKATEALWPEEAERLRAGAEAHPIASTVGSVSAVGPFISPGALTKEALKASVGQRAIGALLTGGTDVGAQLATTGTVDPTQATIQTAGGAAFGGAPTALGRKIGLKPVPHGTAGSEVTANTAQEAKLPVDAATTEFAGVGSTKVYPKKSTPAEPGETGVNVGPDKTLAHVFEQASPELDAKIRDSQTEVTINGQRQPGMERAVDEQVRQPIAAQSFEIVDRTTGEVVDSRLTQADAFRNVAGNNRYEIRPGEGAPLKLSDVVGGAEPEPRTAAAARSPDDVVRGPEPSVDEQMRAQGVDPRRPGEPLQTATPEEIDARMRAAGVEPEEPISLERVTAAVRSGQVPLSTGSKPGLSAEQKERVVQSYAQSLVKRAETDPQLAADLRKLNPEMAPAGVEPGSPEERNAKIQADQKAQLDATGKIRLYRGERPGERLHAPGSAVTGGWFTSDPAKAAKYGDVKYIDVDINGLKYFAQGHGGVDEFVTDNPIFRDRSRPLKPTTPREAIEQRAPGETVGDVLRQRAGEMPSPTGGGQVPPSTPGAGGAAAGTPPTPPPAAPQPPQTSNRILDQIKNVFAPQTRGPLARQLADWIRGAYGESTQIHEQTKAILAPHADTVRAMDQEDLRKLVNRAQGGNAFPDWQPNQAQQGLLTDIKRVADMWATKLGTLDRAQQMEWIKNYLPGMYKNPDANPQYFQDFARGMGGTGSLKTKKFLDYEAARAAGLEPYTNDPIRMMELYGEKMRNFIGRQEALEKGLRSGLFIKSQPPERIGATGSPEPQVKTNLPPNYVESKTTRGLYMPEEVRAAWDNFHSAGLRGGGQKDLYEAVRATNSAWTNLELSFNGYHAFTMANEAIISDVAMALEKMAGGNFAGGLKTLAQAPGAFVSRARLGSRVQQSYLDPNSTDPITQVLKQVGFRPIGRSHAQDSMLAQKTFLNSFKDIPKQLQQAMQESRQDWLDSKGNMLQQVAYPFRLAQRAIATVSHPLFEVYIPKLKAGAAYAQMEHWRGANPDKIGSAEELVAARKIVDSIDNRFGEMITDHLFMNKVVQDMSVASLRSFSWLTGSIKEIGGGTYSGARAVGRAVRTGDISQANVLNPANKNYDPRVAYAIAMPMTIAATSAMYQYFLGSKDAPASLRDLYAPRTGGIVPGPGGEVQEHMLMPGYHKDVYSWFAHPGVEAYNKLGGAWTTAIEEARGRGSPAIGSPPFIRPEATFTENAIDRMNYFFGKIGPIGVKAFLKGQKEGSQIPDVLTAAGFHPPGMELQAPDAVENIKGKVERRDWKSMIKRSNRDAESRGQPLPYPPQ